MIGGFLFGLPLKMFSIPKRSFRLALLGALIAFIPAPKTGLKAALPLPYAMDSLSARDISSIRSHAEVRVFGSTTLETAVLKKGQDKIRMVVKDQAKPAASVWIIYNNGRITRELRGENGRSAYSPQGTEAAVYLFDLLALNPNYHFPEDRNGFNLECSVLEGFSIEIERERAEADSSDKEPVPTIKAIHLHEVDGQQRNLLRSIEYVAFKKFEGSIREPSRMRFMDGQTGTMGRIEVGLIAYNAGIPDFIFELPATEESNSP